MVFQQFCGINALLGNLNDIMSKSSINIDPGFQSAIENIAQLMSSLIASFMMDVIGRKKMWVISNVGMIIGFVLYIAFAYMNSYCYLLAAVMFWLMITFSLGFGPIPWLICHDLFTK